jgi:hypothetical protein
MNDRQRASFTRNAALWLLVVIAVAALLLPMLLAMASMIGWIVIIPLLGFVCVSLIGSALDHRRRRSLGGVRMKSVGASVHPVCLGCGYDVHGVKGDACPECGRSLIPRPICPACGYDVGGVTSPLCPECGRTLEDRIDTTQLPPAGTLDACCIACGYDLRACTSIVCSECAQPRRLRLEFSPDDFLRARAALGQRDMVLGEVHAVNDFMLGQQPGAIWICSTRWPEARWALEAANISLRERGRPIVDRAEPICPRCGMALNPHGSETCPRCGNEFAWVEIDATAAPESA